MRPDEHVHMQASRSLGPGLATLFEPASIAIIGASGDASRIGGRPLLGALNWGYKGLLYPINPRHTEVQGLACLPSVRDIGHAPDLAIIALPAEKVLDAMEECAQAGVRNALVFSSGFSELGGEGTAMQSRMQELARTSGMRIVGPNCMGIMNPALGLYGTFSSILGPDKPDPSGISIVSQSGAFGIHCIALMLKRGLGLGLWGTTGNQVDVEFSEVLEYMIDAPQTKVVVGCVEGVRDGARFIRVLEKARRKRVPVVMMKIGTSDVGAQAAATHTATLTGSDDIFNEVLLASGVRRAKTIEELFDIGYACSAQKFPARNTVGILSISGGFGIALADAASEAGIEVPPLPEETQAQLKTFIPYAGTRNPLDVTAQFINDSAIVGPAFDAVLRHHDSMVCYLGATGTSEKLMAKVDSCLADVAAQHKDKLLLMSAIMTPPVRRRYEGMGYLVYEEPTRCISAIAALRDYARSFAIEEESAPAGPGSEPRPAGMATLNEEASRALVERAGIPVVRHKTVTSPDGAATAARELGFPVAMKVLSVQVPHKSDVGGVVLSIVDEASARDAFSRILASVTAAVPHAHIEGVLVSPMIGSGVEMIMGVKHDPVFGPITVIGFGGVLVEVLQDTAIAVGRISHRKALQMIHSLKGIGLLLGVRGRPPTDIDALAQALVAVSAYACANAAWLEGIDINPVIVRGEGEGVIAVDALVQLGSSTTGVPATAEHS
ncbi:MAG: acetate--CoA ligase family protein [Polaromonas sp.]|uniref:acetate--CoA ligase family protein n=1 Tax=Polaromonas sp. TaxID=1869339 RepID=UPI0025DBD2B0|nr:acetate--CoA ligase family protein [Polaromonas sp.]MBI2727740.1 acetate--CoA ligase family protein [Polaromonas sp.]